MRDDDESPHTTAPLPLAVMVQPDPMPEERPAGPFQIIATTIGAAAIVTLALYGMSRPPEPQQMAAAPSEEAQNAQAPTATGQGAGEHAGQPDTKGQQQPKGQADQSKTPPASGGSTTNSAVGPGAKPAPQAR